MPRVGFPSAPALSLQLHQQHPLLLVVLLALLLLLLVPLSGPGPLGVAGAGVPKGGWGSPSIPVSGVIIPGFASSRLRAWALLDCPYSPLDFRPLDPVWLDTKKGYCRALTDMANSSDPRVGFLFHAGLHTPDRTVLSVLNCWLKCMLLDPATQADHPECKSRPDTGLSAITELDPGYITGALSSVWREWVNWLVEFGIEPDAIVAVPYDWRLPGAMLEERDLYFHKLKIIFETARKLRGGPSLVYAHSMGNNVFRYFLEWLKLEIAPKHYLEWLDHHIHAYYSVGAPFLGAAETVKALLSGVSFGLPISDGTARLMCNSFASSLWMLPFSKHCHVRHERFSNFRESDPVVEPYLVCDIEEYEGNWSSWPVAILKIDLPASPGSCPATELVAHPIASLGPDVMGQSPQCSMPSQKSYSAHQVSSGSFLRDILEHDINSTHSLQHLIKYYMEDPILNPLTPWSRPPIKNVYCIYGVDMKTEVGYHYSPSGKPYPDNWIISDIIYETEGGVLQSRSGIKVNDSTGSLSGDASVPYNSLSFCKTWLGPRVNITRTPQTAHEVSDMQEQLNVEHGRRSDVVPNMTRDSRVKYITYYEDGISLPGKRTAVWELDKIDHRNIVRSPILLRELWLETAHSYHKDAKRQFVSKERREPMRDEDCFWDYAKARCGRPDRCEYRYVFGDVHLGQSCRLQASSDKDHILRYI